MPRISIVVPIYNVERFLDECLESIARQTVSDFEVVMVEDGSSDDSPAIAERFAARDERFRLVRQPNGGLGKARNTGSDAATGEFIAFVDSDDVLPDNAYELLLGALDETGSDFATGNVQRLSPRGLFQSPFLAKTFTRTRLKTHITEFRPLLADRTAWNKLWRRSFWDANGYRFPEGVLNEDIPVVLPAHFAARSVDVIADPVYYWRLREGGGLSITQRRLERRALLDRLAATEQVRAYLREHGPRKARRWYDEHVLGDDLRYYVNVLDNADDEYRELFLDRVNELLDTAHRRVFEPLPAIERLKWHLVRRRLMPELIEVLRFQREDMKETPPVAIGGRWYGDYPFRTDERLKIPRSVYELRGELYLTVHVDELRREGEQVQVRGFAYINGVDAGSPGSLRISAALLRPGRLQRVRLRTSAVRCKVEPERRPDANALVQQRFSDLTWSGWAARVDLGSLRRAGRWREGRWELYVTVRAGKIRRRRQRFVFDPTRPLRALDLAAGGDDVSVSAGPATVGTTVGVDVASRWATVRGHELADGKALELALELHGGDGAEPRLEATRQSDGKTRRFKLEAGGEDDALLRARVKLANLRGDGAVVGADEDDEDEESDTTSEPDIWDLNVVGGGHVFPVRFADGGHGSAWPVAGGELVLFRNRAGSVSLVERAPRPSLTHARWADGGILELRGFLRGVAGTQPELVVARRDGVVGAAVPLAVDGDDGGFTARLAPARIGSLAGALPLPEATWELHVRPAPDAALAPVMTGSGLLGRLPLTTVVDHKSFTLHATRHERVVLAAQRDLAEDERGPFNQRRMRTTDYGSRRSEPLRDTVVYSSFSGRQYSDNPRQIHEELVRRGVPLEHLWVVRDGQAEVPTTATVLREGSREFHEALATSRYVVFNDHFPAWFERRPDQRCIQTWHGTPLKRLGLDVSEMWKRTRKFERRWAQQVENWQYVVSPNRFATPILRAAYALEGELLETGYPRNDLLAGPDRDARSRAVRERLGIPEGMRTILYAPTFRDDNVDLRGRYRLDLRLDLERLREAAGPDTLLLFRKHHYIVDPVPAGPAGFVRDVSAYPDGTELMLAADVLVTDYSSMMFDFANTGRPMLFFTYDLEAYEQEIRGFYFDFAATAPGPLLETSDDVATAVRELDAVQAEYTGRYEEFAAKYCEFDDGQAAARVVDHVFAEAAVPQSGVGRVSR